MIHQRHRRTYRRTDRRRDSKTVLCTVVHRAVKSTPMVLCLNTGSVAKLVVGDSEFQTLTTLSAKNWLCICTESPPSVDRFAPSFVHSRSYWHNHLWQISWQLVKVGQFCGAQNSHFPLTNRQSQWPLTFCRRYCAASDQSQYRSDKL